MHLMSLLQGISFGAAMGSKSQNQLQTCASSHRPPTPKNSSRIICLAIPAARSAKLLRFLRRIPVGPSPLPGVAASEISPCRPAAADTAAGTVAGGGLFLPFLLNR